VAKEFAQDKLVRFLLEKSASQSTPLESSLDCVRILSGLGQTGKGQQVRQPSRSLDPLRVSDA